tara:strand:+ start:1612 stop:1788 length:177 start_codon:yes stop_codon:yes gene_type:complete
LNVFAHNKRVQNRFAGIMIAFLRYSGAYVQNLCRLIFDRPKQFIETDIIEGFVDGAAR